MKARHHAQIALLTLASFAVGLTWARNWPALIGLAIGSVMMTLIMGLLHSAKRDKWKVWHQREMSRERFESRQRGFSRGVEWARRQRIGRTEDDGTDAFAFALHCRHQPRLVELAWRLLGAVKRQQFTESVEVYTAAGQLENFLEAPVGADDEV